MKFDGTVRRFEYDGANRQTRRWAVAAGATDESATSPALIPGSEVATAYDAPGRRVRVEILRADMTVDAWAWAYDERGRLTSVAHPTGESLHYAYDAAGNLLWQEIRDAAATVNPVDRADYAWDELNRLIRVTRGARVWEYRYDAAGRRTALFAPNGTKVVYEYDDRDRLRRLANLDSMDNVIAEFNYTHLDPAGNRRRVTDMVRDPGTMNLLTAENYYGYDPLHRLRFEDRIGDSAYGRVHEYDQTGNRYSALFSATSGGGGSGRSYLYNARDQLTSMQGAGTNVSYQYDRNGNQTREIERTPGAGGAVIQTTDYEWNEDDRLVGYMRADGTGALLDSAAYEHDADGNRISVTDGTGGVTRFLVDTNNPTGYAQVVRESGAASAAGPFTETRRYIYGDDLLAELRPDMGGMPAVVAIHYHYDGLGSTRALTDESGSLLGSLSYEGYGPEISTSGNTDTNYRYTGEQYDSGLAQYYLRARYMDPRTGRFTSLDPLMGNTNIPISMNKYLYAEGNPISRIDPSGERSLLNVVVTLGLLASLTGHVGPNPVNRTTATGCCGPDITDQLVDVVERTRSWFETWETTPGLQQSQCGVLRNVLFSGPIGPGNAWDINELHSGASEPGGAMVYEKIVRPGCPSESCWGTVTVNGYCNYGDAVNYAIFGTMMRLCSDIKSIPNRADFSLLLLAGSLRMQPHNSEKQIWAEAGYGGWPNKSKSGGVFAPEYVASPRLQSKCRPCTQSARKKQFSVRWGQRELK